jgi:hypothetical protein
MPAVTISWSLRGAQTPKAKIRMDADALGRQDVGCFQFPGFLRSKTPSSKNGMDAIF